jgi:hypothetical protein
MRVHQKRQGNRLTVIDIIVFKASLMSLLVLSYPTLPTQQNYAYPIIINNPVIPISSRPLLLLVLAPNARSMHNPPNIKQRIVNLPLLVPT